MPADFDKFLEKQAHQGDLVSEGVFTVDLLKARQRLAADTLESAYHYVLKFVQIANLVRADSLSIQATRAETEICIDLAGMEGQVWGPQAAFALLTGQRGESDGHELLLGLLACLDHKNTVCHWELWVGNSCRRLTLKQGSALQVRLVDRKGVERHGLRLLVEHGTRWNPWKVSERISGIRKLIEDTCRYSPTPITCNGAPIPCAQTCDLNSHLSDFGGSQFNVAIGAFQDAPRPVAASCILYQLAESGPRLAIQRPSLEEYRVFEGRLNVWERALSRRNTLRPNGQTVPAWMLQYREVEDNIPMTGRPERELCSAVLVMNFHAIGNMEPLRLNVVRHGVLCLANPNLDEEFDTEAFKGCTLVLADDQLNADLGGLQIRRDQRLKETLLGALQYLRAGEEYFEQCAKVLTFA